ncbi:MAG: hypothetical protein EHM33_13125 [Chloroflexi bacterium]|nr:MAG: hypothetical protein EHM33_13125 [Chloroflexota bacterium]
MNRHYLPLALSASVILIAIVACVLPGQTVQPAPVTNPVSIESAVAGTAQAAAQQTQQANPVPATATFLPTEAPMLPEVISSYGTSLVKRGDGSTQFRDYRAGVQIIFPPNWLPMRPGEPEYYEAWEKGSQNQWILEEIASIQNLDLNVFRVNSYDMHPEHTLYDILPKINVVFQQGDLRTLEQVEDDEKRMIENSVQAGHEVLSSDYRGTSGGLQTLVFENQSQSKSSDNIDFMFYNKGTYFRVPTGMVFIDLFLSSEMKDALQEEYDQIFESITLFNP